jgi:hypothetical protein
VGKLRIDLNIALVPDSALAAELVAVSIKFADHYPAIVRLGDPGARLSLAPHLTLYQVPVPLERLDDLHDGLRRIARSARALNLACTGLAYNAGEASLEAQTESPADLARLQDDVIALANPMRGGLFLERDPAGNAVSAARETPGVLGDNIRETGYGEVGELFRPHDTLNWFTAGTRVDESAMENMVNTGALSGRYPVLAMFTLGPYGTCPQLLGRYELGH